MYTTRVTANFMSKVQTNICLLKRLSVQIQYDLHLLKTKFHVKISLSGDHEGQQILLKLFG